MKGPTDMRRASSHAAAVGAAATHGAAVLTALLTAGPILLVVWAAFRAEPFGDLGLGANSWSLQSFRSLLDTPNVGRWVANSFGIAAVITAATVLVDVLAAFAFAKLRFPGRDGSFALLIATIMLPFATTVIPVYLIMAKAGLTDTYAGIILPGLAGAFGVFLLRQFISTIPDSLLESARIDGASHWRMFWIIVFPLCVQPMGVLAIATFVSSWNAFLWPLLVVQSDEMRTLPVGIATTNTQFVTNVQGQTAAALVSLLPMLILFVLFQRYFIRGVLAGSIKE